MTVFLVLFLLYVVPGFAAAAIFTDRTRLNPAVWVLASLIVVPVVLANLGSLGLRTTTTPVGLAITMVLVTATFWGLAMAARRLAGGVAVLSPERDASARLPRLLGALLLAIFWVGVTGARHSLLSGHVPSVGDDLERIGQITSVAVTGVPPRHYYLPETALSYYYYDVVLPGIAVRMAEPALSVAAAIFFHVALQTFAVAAALYWIAFRLCRPWSAVLLIALLTVASGWDYWMVLTNDALGLSHIEQWEDFRWYPPFHYFIHVPRPFFEISLPTTLAIWVPHHWLAGFVALLLPVIVCYMTGSRWLRAVLLGITLAFVAGCSVFVGIGLAAGVALWLAAFAWQRWRQWDLRPCLITFAVAAALSANLLWVYAGKRAMIGLYTPRGLSRNAPTLLFLLGKAVTLPDFIADVVVESGGTVALFVVWLCCERGRILLDPAKTWIAAVGLGLLPWTFFFRSPMFDDFGMRGIVPAQFAWCVGAAWSVTAAAGARSRHLITAAALLAVLLALPSGARSLLLENRRAGEVQEVPRSIAWINAHTPLDSPVLMMQPLSQYRDFDQYLLERVRLIDFDAIAKLLPHDHQYIQSALLGDIAKPFWSVESRHDVCRTAQRLGSRTRSAYVIDVPQGARGRRIFKTPVVADEYGLVFEVDCGDHAETDSGFAGDGRHGTAPEGDDR